MRQSKLVWLRYSSATKCEHNNFNDYFEKCEDRNMSLYDMPQEIQDLYEAQFSEEGIEEIIGKAEFIRDARREDGEV